ncbi:MAG TPA: hypothetical protein VFY40_02550 [Blastocatellia bacterium]|nr:hypothetical protein [Blastocatellia bacterium]
MSTLNLLEMATAFGVRWFGTALVVISDSTDFKDEGPSGFSPIIAKEPKLTTKAAPSSRTPKAPPICAVFIYDSRKRPRLIIAFAAVEAKKTSGKIQACVDAINACKYGASRSLVTNEME